MNPDKLSGSINTTQGTKNLSFQCVNASESLLGSVILISLQHEDVPLYIDPNI